MIQVDENSIILVGYVIAGLFGAACIIAGLLGKDFLMSRSRDSRMPDWSKRVVNIGVGLVTLVSIAGYILGWWQTAG